MVTDLSVLEKISEEFSPYMAMAAILVTLPKSPEYIFVPPDPGKLYKKQGSIQPSDFRERAFDNVEGQMY